MTKILCKLGFHRKRLSEHQSWEYCTREDCDYITRESYGPEWRERVLAIAIFMASGALVTWLLLGK
jgi:hypothetical protein